MQFYMICNFYVDMLYRLDIYNLFELRAHQKLKSINYDNEKFVKIVVLNIRLSAQFIRVRLRAMFILFPIIIMIV